MKAPDIVYIEFSEDGNLAFEERPFEETPAYLRKDALLEWAKGQKARLKQGYKKDWKNEDTLNGGRFMLDKLINKLNSM